MANIHGSFHKAELMKGKLPEEAMYRELHEEVGLTRKDVTILGVTRNWMRYKLPKRLIRQGSSPVCIGQKQKWFLLQLDCQDKDVDVLKSGHPEFDDWRWVSYWYPIRNVVSFKRDVYRKVMKEFAGVAMPVGQRVHNTSSNKRHRKRRRNG